jgi:hypothetical protein
MTPIISLVTITVIKSKSIIYYRLKTELREGQLSITIFFRFQVLTAIENE